MYRCVETRARLRTLEGEEARVIDFGGQEIGGNWRG